MLDPIIAQLFAADRARTRRYQRKCEAVYWLAGAVLILVVLAVGK